MSGGRKAAIAEEAVPGDPSLKPSHPGPVETTSCTQVPARQCPQQAAGSARGLPLPQPSSGQPSLP